MNIYENINECINIYECTASIWRSIRINIWSLSSGCLDLAEKACLRHSPTHMSGSDSEVYPREFRVAGFLSQSRQRRLPAIGSSQSMNWV